MAISQYPTRSQESRRRKRNCLPEIATGAKRPRNDKSGSRCHFNGGPFESAALRRARLSAPLHWPVQFGSAFPRLPRRFAPRNDNSGAVTILTEACFARQCAAGPGCPRPYSALSMSAQKFINYSASLKYAARSCIRFSSNGEVRLPSCSMARNVDSGAAYSRSLKAASPAPSVSCSSW